MAATIPSLGAASALLILYRIVEPPGFGGGGTTAFQGTVQLPIYLALFASLGIALGGILAMRQAR